MQSTQRTVANRQHCSCVPTGHSDGHSCSIYHDIQLWSPSFPLIVMPDADSILRSPVCLRVYVYTWLFFTPRSVPCLRNMHLLGLHVYRYDTQRFSMLMPSASLLSHQNDAAVPAFNATLCLHFALLTCCFCPGRPGLTLAASRVSCCFAGPSTYTQALPCWTVPRPTTHQTPTSCCQWSRACMLCNCMGELQCLCFAAHH